LGYPRLLYTHSKYIGSLTYPERPSRSAAIIIVVISTKHSFSSISIYNNTLTKTEICCQELSYPKKTLENRRNRFKMVNDSMPTNGTNMRSL
jgi:hypothetical protein